MTSEPGNISALFIRRPVATILIMVGALILGAVSFSYLPIASLPTVERPTIGVWGGLPGASPITVATTVAQPLEAQLGTIPGVVEMSSYSTTGGTWIALQFDLRKDIDAAGEEVQAAINAASPNLPTALSFPPSYYKSNPAGFALAGLSFKSDVVPTSEIYQFVDGVIGPRLTH